MDHSQISKILHFVALVFFALAMYAIVQQPWDEETRIQVYVVAAVTTAADFAHGIWWNMAEKKQTKGRGRSRERGDA
ncbi:MAG: hypothetical protein JJ921_08485 [Pseudomonadales bacterium]|nr:hypothetical protein [Pseudomonadales bacterium]MBO7007300.1 hypothetical protein [Pseudomonadales bacterium]